MRGHFVSGFPRALLSLGQEKSCGIEIENVSESLSSSTEDKNIILKAYSTQKVGSGGKFESGNQGYGRRQIQTHEAQMVYLIKLTHQKDANHIFTRKCFTIAIKTIQLSSHVIKHDEFIEATFSSEIFL